MAYTAKLMLSVISHIDYSILYSSLLKLPSKSIISLLFGELSKSIISLLFWVSIPNTGHYDERSGIDSGAQYD